MKNNYLNKQDWRVHFYEVSESAHNLTDFDSNIFSAYTPKGAIKQLFKSTYHKSKEHHPLVSRTLKPVKARPTSEGCRYLCVENQKTGYRYFFRILPEGEYLYDLGSFGLGLFVAGMIQLSLFLLLL